MRINGVGVCLLALACGIVAWLLMLDQLLPDQLMTPWGVQLSQAQTIVAGSYALLRAGCSASARACPAAPGLSRLGQA